MKNGIGAFISETAQNEHREYLVNLKHKANIWKKSGIAVVGASDREIFSLRLSRQEKESLIELRDEIKLHEIYFDSFRFSYMPSVLVKKSFGSENNFAYELSRLAKVSKANFISVYVDKYNKVGFCEGAQIPFGASVKLALDICEHAYFRDYGFNKEKYIRSAVAHLNLAKLAPPSENITKKD